MQMVHGKGGIPAEGSNYGVSLGDYPLVPFVTSYLLGRDIYNETDYFKGLVMYEIYTTTPSLTYNKAQNQSFYETFPFADDERFRNGGFILVRDYIPSFMSMAASYWGNIGIGQYARQWLNQLAPTNVPPYIQATDQGSTARSFTTLPLDYYAPGPNYIYGRTNWGPQATTWNIQGVTVEEDGHGHSDVGNWQIWRNGRWLVRETTGYSTGDSVPWIWRNWKC
jgi:hypothetical protein